MYKILFSILFIMIGIIIYSSISALKVRLLEYKIKKINYQINEHYQTLQNLKAEWNFLNQPEYLKIMSKKYLNNIGPSDSNDSDKIFKIPLKLNTNGN